MGAGINYPKIVDDTFYRTRQQDALWACTVKEQAAPERKMYFQRDHGGGDDAV